ncbi:MAG: hypothetical protein DRN81_04670 [Thermoproteota archaeon]|nr:MAG: hypothetical protein DRN81_04670 [Candidatus Korarchaeota archaeon]
MADNMRYVETFYGYYTSDWVEDYGSGAFSNNHYVLEKNYISTGCITVETSTATTAHKFLYPHNIEKVYFIEGVIGGHITVAASTATSTVTNYRVSLCKVDNAGNETELFTTGTITVGRNLSWDSTYSIGEEVVLPFWIDAWEKATLTENEKIYLLVEVSGSNTLVLWHSNDSTWEDLKIDIPFRM